MTGLDIGALACAIAYLRLAEAIQVDIMDHEQVVAARGERRFDWLMAADVLEHSTEPWSMLAFYRRFLKPDGRLVVSLPNVGLWDNRLRLLFGRFNNSDSGVMDPTHLRFFTFRAAQQLVSGAGFTLLQTTWEPGIVRAFLRILKHAFGRQGEPGSIVESPAYRFYTRYVMPVEHVVSGLAPGLFAFRVVLLVHR